MKTYLMIHTHKFGYDTFLFQSDKEFNGLYNESNCRQYELQYVFDAVGADVEFHSDESVDFRELNINDIPIAKKESDLKPLMEGLNTTA